jgi:hypothetical protein
MIRLTKSDFGEPTEARFLGMVLKLAKMKGWRTAHFRPARTATGWKTAVQGDGKGFPDLVLVKGSRLLVVELKVKRGQLTQEQQAWLLAFKGAGIEAHCWRPRDWPEIERVLMG